LCRERAAKRPRISALMRILPGLLRSPFATQGRSYKGTAIARPAVTALALAITGWLG